MCQPISVHMRAIMSVIMPLNMVVCRSEFMYMLTSVQIPMRISLHMSL